jgi:hypothetical protein
VLVLGSLPPHQFAKNDKSQRRRRAADEDGPVVARVTVRDREELDRLVALGLDLLETREGDDLFALTTAARVRQLRRDGWQVAVDKGQTALVRRQRPELRGARAKGEPEDGPRVGASVVQGGYLTVAEMRAHLDQRAAQYPNLAQVFVYGESWERVSRGPDHGNELFGVELTNRERPGPKPTFFLQASIHARELVTSELAVRFVDHLLAGYGVDADATWLLDEHRVVVVPVVNPDGRRLAEQGLYQRKNTNLTSGLCPNPVTPYDDQAGVDLNRNHDFKWGTVDTPATDPCSQVYPGASAASEPETAALQTLVRSYFADQRGPLDTDAAPPDTTGVLITLHSYANLVMWPWGHTSGPAPNGAGLSMIGRKFASYNGYTPQQANVLYPSSGKTDEWAYGELGIPAYVFEVGIGEGECGGFMPPYSCLDGGYEGSFWPRNLPAFLYAARIARAPYLLAEGPAPEAIAAIPTAGGGGFELRAQFDERASGGQRIAAAEYYVDAPPWRNGTPVPMTPADGNFDGAVETATAAVGQLEGSHILYVRAQDEQGNWGPVRATFSPGDSSSCAYAVTPASLSFDAGRGAGAVTVTATSGCGWTSSVSSGASWITITSAGFGTGDGSVSFSVEPNNGTSSRTGTLTVSGRIFTVTQGAFTLNSFTLNPTSVKGGQPSTGTLNFTGTAPAGGAVVSLSSNNTAAATVPATVTVPAGVSSHTFSVTTQPVAANSSASITVKYGAVTWTILLTLTPAVLAPTSLTATPGAGKVDLKWADKSTNESGFHIERCEGSTCTNFAQIATVKANTISYRNTSLGARRTYRYRVRAYNSSGFSVYTNIAAATTK